MVLTVWAYSPLLSAGWVHEDIAPPSSRGMVAEVRDLSFVPRGLTALSMRLQGASSARQFHLVNVGVHLLNGLLLYALVGNLWLVGLFWLHPIQSEAVSYVAARADLLLVTTIFCVLLAARTHSTLLLLLCLALAVGVKETGVVAIGLLALWCWYTDRRQPYAVLAIATMAALYIAVPFLAHLSSWTAPPPTFPIFLLQQASAIWGVLALIIWPVGFTPAHEWTPSVFAAMALSLPLLLAWTCRRRVPAVTFAVCWLAISLAPRMLVPVPHPLTEHVFYLPLVGLVLAAA